MSREKTRSAIILDRLREEIGASTDVEMARILQVAQSTYSGWKSRDTADLLLVISACDNLGYTVDWDWVLNNRNREPSTKFGAPSPPNSRCIPLFLAPASAGSPSPADDHIEAWYSCERIIPNPENSFACRVTGDSMVGAGIGTGDVLIVERRDVVDGDIAVVSVNGELTVKRIRQHDGVTYLYPENEHYKPITVREGDSFTAWGTVLCSIKSHK